MTLGMLASVILYIRLKDVSTINLGHAQAQPSLPVREALNQLRGLMLPIMAILFITAFLNANIVNYLPTFMSREGSSFAVAGISLTVVEMGASVGVLLMGLFSDRLGHRNIVLWGTLASVGFALGFLMVTGWMQMVMLVGIGLSAFIANPAFLAMVLSRSTLNRSLANGVYMSSSFVLRSIVVVIVGALADRFGMRPVFVGSALAVLLAIPLIFLLPKS
jgi:MFS family permease